MRCAILLASVFVLAATASFDVEETFNEELPSSLMTKVPEDSLVEGPVKVGAMAQQVFTEAELSAKGPYWKWTNKFKTKDDGKYRLRERMSNQKVTKQEWTLIESAKQIKMAKQTKAMPKMHKHHLKKSHHHKKGSELVESQASFRPTYHHGLFRENVFYFRQGCHVPHLANRRPNMQRWKHNIYYRNTGGRWPGFARANHFAVRWTGRVRFYRSGHYRFSLISDDGSKLWIDNRYTINNDGCHGWRNREANRYIHAGWRLFRVQYFEHGGHAGILLRYRGPDTGNHWRVLNARGHRGQQDIYRHGLFREYVYYFRQGNRVPNLRNRRPNMQRWKHNIYYRNTSHRWPGFARADNFAVKWTGRVRFFRRGHYRFSLISDDGSKLWIDNRYTINNDGLHGWRNREATRYIHAGWRMFRVEFFERTGHAGIMLRYRGPDTHNRWRVVRAGGYRARRRSLSRGCRRKCYRPNVGPRKIVCAYQCSGRRRL